MMAVIFEVWPASGRKDDYLKLAASLRAEVEQIDGYYLRGAVREPLRAGQAALTAILARRGGDHSLAHPTSSTSRPRLSDGVVCLLTTGCALRRWCGTTALRIGRRPPLTPKRRS